MDILENFYKALNNHNYNKYKDSVVVISKNGILKEEDLDEKPYNHAIVTCSLAFQLNAPYFETEFPFVAGMNAARYGLVVLHIHKAGIGICFFPDSLTRIQYIMLKEKLEEMKDFSFQYSESMQDEGFVAVDNVLDYAKKLVNDKGKTMVNYHFNVLRKIKN